MWFHNTCYEMSFESSCSQYTIYYDVLCDSNQHYLIVVSIEYYI